jgi:FAD:protein FMN transferase
MGDGRPGCRRVETVMGTVISVDVRDWDPDVDILDEVFAWFHHVDATFSTYKQSSDISRLARGEVTIEACDPYVAWVLRRCDEIRALTGGYFDAMATGVLDPSGFVKGWSVEVASARLADGGMFNHCINAGGDVRVRGEPEEGRRWKVGIVDPLCPGVLATSIGVRDGAVATSGISERGDHVVDPHTGTHVTSIASVTLVGADLAQTDAYATAALAMGSRAESWLETLCDQEAYIIAADGRSWRTAGFAAYSEDGDS